MRVSAEFRNKIEEIIFYEWFSKDRTKGREPKNTKKKIQKKKNKKKKNKAKNKKQKQNKTKKNLPHAYEKQFTWSNSYLF